MAFRFRVASSCRQAGRNNSQLGLWQYFQSPLPHKYLKQWSFHSLKTHVIIFEGSLKAPLNDTFGKTYTTPSTRRTKHPSEEQNFFCFCGMQKGLPSSPR